MVLGMGSTYGDWLASPWPLDPVDVGGFYAYELGWSLHELDGHLALSVLSDDEGPGTVVLKLSPALEGEARQFLPFSRETLRPFQEWLSNIRFDECDVLGASSNDLYQALTELGDLTED